MSIALLKELEVYNTCSKEQQRHILAKQLHAKHLEEAKPAWLTAIVSCHTWLSMSIGRGRHRNFWLQ